jgi:hypothetical protein
VTGGGPESRRRFRTPGEVEAVPAIVSNIEIRTYSTFRLPVLCMEVDPTGTTDQLQARDLTGWTGAMQVRATEDDATVLAEAAVEVDVVNSIVTAVIDADTTALYVWRSGVYDLIITDGDEVDPLVTGVARCTRGVTR